MAYEYEDKVIKILKNLGALYNSNINFRMAEEVKEVYAKAKVFDEILNIDYIVAPDDYAHEVTKIIDKYMEDK